MVAEVLIYYHSGMFVVVCVGMQLTEMISPATSLSSEEQQNKFAQLLFKVHMSYLDTEVNQSETSLINLHFQKCFEKVNLTLI